MNALEYFARNCVWGLIPTSLLPHKNDIFLYILYFAQERKCLLVYNFYIFSNYKIIGLFCNIVLRILLFSTLQYIALCIFANVSIELIYRCFLFILFLLSQQLLTQIFLTFFLLLNLAVLSFMNQK
jgi:hypothetical protein